MLPLVFLVGFLVATSLLAWIIDKANPAPPLPPPEPSPPPDPPGPPQILIDWGGAVNVTIVDKTVTKTSGYTSGDITSVPDAGVFSNIKAPSKFSLVFKPATTNKLFSVAVSYQRQNWDRARNSLQYEFTWTLYADGTCEAYANQFSPAVSGGTYTTNTTFMLTYNSASGLLQWMKDGVQIRALTRAQNLTFWSKVGFVDLGGSVSPIYWLENT